MYEIPAVIALETNQTPKGDVHSVTCEACAYVRDWQDKRQAEHDQLTHKCPPEDVRTVSAVWIDTKGKMANIRWCYDPLVLRVGDRCIYCAHIGQTGECPGALAHSLTQQARESDVFTQIEGFAGTVEAGVFDVPVFLTPHMAISEIQHRLDKRPSTTPASEA